MGSEWDKIKNILKKSLKPGIFNLWIRPLRGEFEDGVLFLEAPNDFVAGWVNKRLLGDIKKAAGEVLNLSKLEVVFKISKDNNHSLKRKSLPFIKPSFVNKKVSIWRYSFEDFVVGTSNELAYSACNLFCKNRALTNTLLLSSDPGLGKTHLLHAIGNYYHKNGKDKHIKIVYISSDQFASLMVKALKNGSFDSFKEFYINNVDILLLEDIHFFQGKYKLQEELLTIIKHLENNGKSIIFSSTFLPKELKRVDSHLTSYLCSGLVVPIHRPDIELRIRILEKGFNSLNLKYSKEICEYIAKHITSDIRQLKSCVQNIALKLSLLNKKKVSLALVKEVVENYKSESSTIEMKDIVDLVCDAFKLNIEMLRSRSRKREVVTARNTAFYLAKRFTDLPLTKIGKYLNRRHSTVIKGITSIEMEIKKDSSIGRQALEIVKKLENKAV